MKRWLWVLFLLPVSFAAVADQPGLGEQDICRDRDPFVYCTQGCKETKAWKPASPYASVAYRPQLGYCPVPVVQTGSCPFDVKPYLIFLGWGQQDYDDYMQHRVVICPRAHTAGDWERYDGQGEPEDEPYSH